MDKDSNIINDTNDPEIETSLEITGANDLNIETTGVDDLDHSETIANTHTGNNTERETVKD